MSIIKGPSTIWASTVFRVLNFRVFSRQRLSSTLAQSGEKRYVQDGLVIEWKVQTSGALTDGGGEFLSQRALNRAKTQNFFTSLKKSKCIKRARPMCGCVIWYLALIEQLGRREKMQNERKGQGVARLKNRGGGGKWWRMCLTLSTPKGIMLASSGLDRCLWPTLDYPVRSDRVPLQRRLGGLSTRAGG